VFNPIRQGEQFDPDGAYVRHWIPELATLPSSAIHQPWTVASKQDYPAPVVDFAASRAEALAGWERIKGG
jgi:deoxyribodipyrimidine photo-lyase